MVTDAMTRNQYIYFYAENQRAGRTGDEFDYVKGERFLYEEPRPVSFLSATREDWKDYEEVFQCPAEAPEP